MDHRTSLVCRLSLIVTAAVLLVAPAEAVKRRAFVTSTTGTGNLATWPGSSGAGALERADSICRARATAAGLPNGSTYRAWLSTDTTDAYCHVQGLTGKKGTGCNGGAQAGGGPWYLQNGVTPFTSDLASLTSQGAIYRPVILDETGSEPTANRHIWTGTSANGAAFAGNCSGWSSTSGTTFPGISNATGGEWTASSLSRACSEQSRLLCLEPGESEVAPAAWPPSAIVFVTSTLGPGDLSAWPEAAGHQGIEAGDAICQTLARQGGLPGAETFVAWLSSTPVDAADRITVDGPFRRLDGFPFAFSKADLLDGFASTTLHVNELRGYIPGPYEVWTATSGAGVLQQGTSCVDWTSSNNGDIAAVGSASRARNAHWTAMTGRPCSATARLYCFQNQITQALPVFADGFELGSTARWSSSPP